MALSRQGRRLLGGAPAWMRGIGGFVLVFFTVCGAALVAHGGDTTSVAYEISGTGTADVELTMPGGRRVHLEKTALPLRRDLFMHGGERAAVTVTGTGGVLVGCTLWIDDRMVAARTDHTAICGGTIGSPETYQPPPPPRGSSPAVLGSRLELQRYTGDRSPTAGRVTDRAAGISYARLTGGWGPPSTSQDNRFMGVPLTSHQESREERGWFASLGSGLLNPELLDRYTGDSRLFNAALAQLDALTMLAPPDGYYEDVASQPLTVDGRQAWLITRHVTIGPKARTSITGEINTLVLIDTGDRRPAFLYITMPSPAQDHLPDVNHLISSLRVL
ncbi:hypothetical protein [Actinomadura atramentaria]|uniref:hypothetical protein n=1 Tax=Actinomadura atramentaria TaxID=1990 RepID=UPI00036A6BE2|nr:hypothetical protein [Actinomadura atramentaria]